MIDLTFGLCFSREINQNNEDFESLGLNGGFKKMLWKKVA